MALKTKKIYEYRGYRVHLRQLGENSFEVVIPMGKSLYEHNFNISFQEGKNEFNEEEFDAIYDMMTEVTKNDLDVKIYQRSLKAKINNLIFNGRKIWTRIRSATTL